MITNSQNNLQKVSLLLWIYTAAAVIVYALAFFDGSATGLRGMLDIAVSAYFAYILPRERNKVVYWSAVILLSLNVVKVFLGALMLSYLIYTEGSDEVIMFFRDLNPVFTFFIFARIAIFISALAYLLPKKVREEFTEFYFFNKPKKDTQEN